MRLLTNFPWFTVGVLLVLHVAVNAYPQLTSQAVQRISPLKATRS